jgi:aminoglycoside phosphotransferase (APT) family kinase protein
MATDLAKFLTTLRGIDASGGPSPGPRNGFRGGALATYDHDTVSAITSLAGEIDADRAFATWNAALASSWDRPAVWVHGDITGSNLLVVDGRLHAVIDFGCVAVGDPACDLAIAWTLFTGTSRHTFRCHVDLDDETWARARGWALWKALITLRDDSSDNATQRFGWRTQPHALIEDILNDS